MNFRELEVFEVRPHFAEVTAGQMDDLELESGGAGLATPWRQTSAIRRTVNLPIALQGLDKIGALRRFFDRQRGRQIPCWLPAWVNDFVIAAGAAAAQTQITVSGHGFTTQYALGAQFKFIALLTRAGKLECYGVTAAVTSGANDLLTLDRGLDTALDASATVCCPLLLARAIEDELEYEYLAGDVVTGAIAWIECPQEYPPPTAGAPARDSAHLGSRPVFLYRITDGTTTLRLADYGVDVVAAEFAWQAADIRGDDLSSTLDMLGDTLNVTLKTSDPAHPLLAYQDRLNARNYTVEVFLLDLDTPAALQLTQPEHIGRIEEVSFSEGAITLEVSSLFRFAETRIPKIQMQRLANGSVYDHVVEATYSTAGTIDAINEDPPWVEASEFGAKATAEGDPNWFALGKVVCGDEIRLCTGESGSRLYLNFPFRVAAVNAAISAAAGDDKRISTWDTKFGVLAKFMGWPYIPSQNPQFKSLQTPMESGGKK